MYHENGTYYDGSHSVSFGDLITMTSEGVSHTAFNEVANTWTDWHLIPASRLIIPHGVPISKLVKIPGSDGMINLTEYLTGRTNYKDRTGSLQFYIDNGHESPESIRTKIAQLLHGKVIKMRLNDDAGYYYEGRFTVGNLSPGADYSQISISYQLYPYKRTIDYYGSSPVLWDTFNFETDYDYSVWITEIEVQNQTKHYEIRADDYYFKPVVRCTSGSITASFRGITKSISSGSSATLGRSEFGSNTLTISGTGSALVQWKGEKL